MKGPSLELQAGGPNTLLLPETKERGVLGCGPFSSADMKGISRRPGWIFPRGPSSLGLSPSSSSDPSSSSNPSFSVQDPAPPRELEQVTCFLGASTSLSVKQEQ